MRRTHKMNRSELAAGVLCVVLVLLTMGTVGEQGRRRAKETVCLANLGQWGSMFELYTKDHDGKFNPGWAVGETELWMNALRPYYGDRWPLLLCPVATRVVQSSTDSGTFRAWYRDTTVPGGGEYRYVSSYGINSWTNHVARDLGPRLREWFWGTTQGVRGTDRIPVFADSTWHDAWPRATDEPVTSPFDFGYGNMGTTGEMNHFCVKRHDGIVNLLFMDWSAQRVGLKELWTLKWHRSYNTEGPWTTAGGALPSDWPEWMRGFKDYGPSTKRGPDTRQ